MSPPSSSGSAVPMRPKATVCCPSLNTPLSRSTRGRGICKYRDGDVLSSQFSVLGSRFSCEHDELENPRRRTQNRARALAYDAQQSDMPRAVLLNVLVALSLVAASGR